MVRKSGMELSASIALSNILLSSGGNGHLIRHRDKCPRRREKNRMSQSQISFNPDGSMRN